MKRENINRLACIRNNKATIAILYVEAINEFEMHAGCPYIVWRAYTNTYGDFRQVSVCSAGMLALPTSADVT